MERKIPGSRLSPSSWMFNQARRFATTMNDRNMKPGTPQGVVGKVNEVQGQKKSDYDTMAEYFNKK